MNYGKRIMVKSLIGLTARLVGNKPIRKLLLNRMEKSIYDDLIRKNPDNRPVKVQEDKYYMAKAIFNQIDKAISKGNMSQNAINGLLNVFLGNVFFGGFYSRQEFMEKNGYRPPSFMTISPGKMCNLRCKGCYAASGINFENRLSWDTLDKIIDEAKNMWGIKFFVISGGEPLLYKDKDKGILDIYEKHNDCYFLMYTNGTLIKKEMAEKMAQLGNITPAISVEGLKKETDERRGNGIFDRILEAFSNLRNAGVPFGISITATSFNTDVITSDEFKKFYFDEQGAIYGWVFQYMPIGREYTVSLMPTPKQRIKLFNWAWNMVKKEKILIADFWNSATASDGCIAGARSGGYLYIDWDGNVMPCVFVPYSVNNINDVYANGGTLDDAINSGFFKAIREWQDEYGYKKPPNEVGNWFRPCFIRDNHEIFLKVVKENNAKGIDENSRDALDDEEYHKKLIEYDEEMERLTGDLWKEYIGNE